MTQLHLTYWCVTGLLLLSAFLQLAVPVFDVRQITLFSRQELHVLFRTYSVCRNPKLVQLCLSWSYTPQGFLDLFVYLHLDESRQKVPRTPSTNELLEYIQLLQRQYPAHHSLCKLHV